MSCEKDERQHKRIFLTRTQSNREECAEKNEVQMFWHEETY